MVAISILRKLDLPLRPQCNSNSSIPTIGSATNRAQKHADNKTPHLHLPCNSNWPGIGIKSAPASALQFLIPGLKKLNSSAIISVRMVEGSWKESDEVLKSLYKGQAFLEVVLKGRHTPCQRVRCPWAELGGGHRRAKSHEAAAWKPFFGALRSCLFAKLKGIKKRNSLGGAHVLCGGFGNLRKSTRK